MSIEDIATSQKGSKQNKIRQGYVAELAKDSLFRHDSIIKKDLDRLMREVAKWPQWMRNEVRYLQDNPPIYRKRYWFDSDTAQ